MTWADYIAWWYEPMNLYHVFVSACMYAIGQHLGYHRGRRKERAELIAKAQLFVLTRNWLNKYNSESK